MFHRRPKHLAPCAALALSLLLTNRAADAATAQLESTFQELSQRLFDAIAAGNRDVWDRAMDPDCIITTEDGEVLRKQDFLSNLRPLPPGFIGKGRIRNLTVRNEGKAAVVNYRIEEAEDILGRQELHTDYLETDTYVLRRDGWRLLAMQTTVVPRDLAALVTDNTEWPDLVGDYRFPGEAASRYKVWIRDGVLVAGRDDKSATRLIELAPLVFHQSGSIHLIVFLRDASGGINELRELHKYNEVRMERVPPPPSPPKP